VAVKNYPIKFCPGVSSELVSFLANSSFSKGCFHSLYKHVPLMPLLKKKDFDQSLPSNYRLISNLRNISRRLQCLYLNHIKSYIWSSPNFNVYQSAYFPNHSTETEVLRTLDYVYQSCDLGTSAALVSLDLSDIVDYSTVLNHFKTILGLGGIASIDFNLFVLAITPLSQPPLFWSPTRFSYWPTSCCCLHAIYCSPYSVNQ
jgi:hypothetical protein